MTFDNPVPLLLLALAALAIDALFPASKGRGWNNSRAATQRDVAEVLRGRRSKNEPDTTGLIVFGCIVFALVWMYGG